MPHPRPARRIVTLTMNPAIDHSFSVERVVAGPKLRSHDLRWDAGGGGINIARAARRLGARVLAVFPAGGPNGARLQRKLNAERLPNLAIAIAGETRQDITARDAATGEEYRFVAPGPRLRTAEAASVLSTVDELVSPPAVLAASGSLPPGAPASFYARLARAARVKGIRMALDTSGAPLRLALAAGVWLVKPNVAELEELAGEPLPTLDERLAACRTIISTGGAQLVALSMAAEGALLVSREEAWRAHAPRIMPVSTVGAGDCFLAGLVRSLSAGAGYPQALSLASAAGAAALLSPGTQLCRRSDVRSLVGRVRVERLWIEPDGVRATRSRRAAA